MRCKYCGSSGIHLANEYKDFSVGKAIAGTVVFGPIGAVAGVTGKKISGYRCSKCGEFMERPMDTTIEQLVNDAVYNAKRGSGYSRYEYYKQQYPNIEEVEYKEQSSAKTTERFNSSANIINRSSVEADSMKVKRKYYYGKWDPESPVYIENVVIKCDSSGDYLSLIIWNQSKETIRSLYLQASVYDDAGDILNTSRCIYQGVNVDSGDVFPVEKAFRLDTDIAYRVDVLCEKVVFVSDDVWRMSDKAEMYQVEETEVINKDDFPRYKHLVKAYENISNNKGTSRPHVLLKKEEYWRCLCGLPVKNGKSCPRCKCDYENEHKICAQSYLEKVQHDAVINKAAERAQKTQEGLRQVEEKINSEAYNYAAKYKAEGTVESLSKAVEIFGQISTYKDAASKAEECQNLINTINKAKEEEKRAREESEKAREKAAEEKAKKLRTGGVIAAISIIVIIAMALTITKVIIPGSAYNKAVALKESGSFDEAIEAFKALNGFKDSEEQIKECETERENEKNDKNYNVAMDYLENGEYEVAAQRFQALEGYKDSEDKYLEAINRIKYETGIEKANSKLYRESIEIFNEIKDFSDSSQKLEEIYSIIIKGVVDGDREICIYLDDVPDDRINKDAKSLYGAAKKYLDDGYNQIAEELFEKIINYEESSKYCKYAKGKTEIEKEYWQDAIQSFSSLNGFLDANEQLEKCKYGKVFKGVTSIEDAIELLEGMKNEDAKELLSFIKAVNKCSGKYNGSKLQNKRDPKLIGDWHTGIELVFTVNKGKVEGSVVGLSPRCKSVVLKSDNSEYRYMLKAEDHEIYFSENKIKANPQINGGIYIYYYIR